MPRSKEQFREIRELKRKQIMDSALEIFAEKGFAATSINMIATNAGISKGLIYNYFTSKEDLINTIALIGFDEFLVGIDRNNDGKLTEDELIYFIGNTFEKLQTNTHYWKLYFLLMVQPEVIKLIEAKLMEFAIPLFISLEAYYKSKGVQNPMAHARLIGAVLDGVCLNYVIEPDNFPLEDIKKIIIDKFI